VLVPNSSPELVRTEDEDDTNTTSTSQSFSFLCSAVFIRENWLTVPAHCILDPSKYNQFIDDLSDDTPQAGPESTEGIGKESIQLKYINKKPVKLFL